MAVSNYPGTDPTVKCYGRIFWFKSIIFSGSTLSLSLPLFLFAANPALWFPGSARLSISSSLHLSSAAEPGPHHPACQSPLYTFNPSYPSPCKAASHTPTSPPPFKTTPSTDALRSPFNFQPNTHTFIYTFTHKRSPSVLQTKHTHNKIQIRRHRYTHMNTHTNRQAGRHCTTPTPSFGTPPLLLFIPPPPNSIIQPPFNKPFPTLHCQSFIQQKGSQITALDLSSHLRSPCRFFYTDMVLTLSVNII